jgi:tetratricopeptide (TPR) repeat protein
VPLFVEELTKAVLESAGQGDRVAAVLGTASPAAQAVPATLHASLMARLDRLGPAAKEIAQIGAVLGREFTYELIEPVAQRPERELQAALDQLREAGLLFCRGVPPHSSYLFKHALVQDAAYSTLLRGRRQELHARVAAALEAHFGDLVERQPELLAHHLTAAGDSDHAVGQWLKAGRHASAKLAYVEAVAHLERGLGLLRSLPESPVRDRGEIELQLALGLCRFTAKGAVDAMPAYTRALELAEVGGEPQQRFEALYGLWQSTRDNVSGGIEAASSLSERLLRMAEREGDDGLRLQAHHSGWTTCLHTGDLAKNREHADIGRLLYDPQRHASHRLLYGGHDPGLAEGLARRGDCEAARAALREGLEIADATGEHKWDAELHRLTGTVLLADNKLDEGQASLQQALHIAQAQQAKLLELRAARDLARLWGERGRRAEARDLLAPVYGWFTEGFDTVDLKEAKALLDQLA